VELDIEIRHVKTGLDRYEEPFVEVVFRTKDFSALQLSKYQLKQTPARIKVVD